MKSSFSKRSGSFIFEFSRTVALERSGVATVGLATLKLRIRPSSSDRKCHTGAVGQLRQNSKLPCDQGHFRETVLYWEDGGTG